jgi:hypothetical protein
MVPISMTPVIRSSATARKRQFPRFNRLFDKAVYSGSQSHVLRPLLRGVVSPDPWGLSVVHRSGNRCRNHITIVRLPALHGDRHAPPMKFSRYPAPLHSCLRSRAGRPCGDHVVISHHRREWATVMPAAVSLSCGGYPALRPAAWAPCGKARVRY